MTEIKNVKFPQFAARMIGNKIVSFDTVSGTVTVPAHVDFDVSGDKIVGVNHYFTNPLNFGKGVLAETLVKFIDHPQPLFAAYHCGHPSYDRELRRFFGELIQPSFTATIADQAAADRIVLALRMICALGDRKLLEGYIGKEAPYKFTALSNKEVHEVAGRRVLQLIIGDFNTTVPVVWETMPLERPELALTKSIYDWVLASKIDPPALRYNIIKPTWSE